MSWKISDVEENPFAGGTDSSATPQYIPVAQEAPAWLLESQKDKNDPTKKVQQDGTSEVERNRYQSLKYP